MSQPITPRRTLLPLALAATALLGACASQPASHNAAPHPAPAHAAAQAPAQAKDASDPVFTGHGNDVRAYIQSFDTNKDGKVDSAEVQQQRQKRFAATDTNGDGAIDMPEYVQEFRQRLSKRLHNNLQDIHRMTDVRFESLAGKGQTHVSLERYNQAGERAFTAFAQGKLPQSMPAPRPGEKRNALQLPTTHTRSGMLELYDRNLDGQLTREEFDQARREQFERTDVNKDQRLSHGEYSTEFDQRIQALWHEIVTREMRQARVRFAVLDMDKDDRITPQEFDRTAHMMFKRVDINGDGHVDEADARAQASAPAARQQHKPQGPSDAKRPH